MAAIHHPVLAFDVNETLSDMGPLAGRFEQVGGQAEMLATWFAGVLRDGLALSLAGAFADFSQVAEAALRQLLPRLEALDRDPESAVEVILGGLRELPVHPDVRPGLQRLQAAGFRLVTLTNGAAANSQSLLQRAGVDVVERHMSVEEVGRWKPAAEVYLHAAEVCAVEPSEMMLVAVHPWDIDGAKRAGLRGAWINRAGGVYPELFQPPDVTCRDLESLAERLIQTEHSGAPGGAS